MAVLVVSGINTTGVLCKLVWLGVEFALALTLKSMSSMVSFALIVSVEGKFEMIFPIVHYSIDENGRSFYHRINTSSISFVNKNNTYDKHDVENIIILPNNAKRHLF